MIPGKRFSVKTSGFRRHLRQREAVFRYGEVNINGRFPLRGGGVVGGATMVSKQKPLLVLLVVTVLAPIVLFTDRLSGSFNSIGELPNPKIERKNEIFWLRFGPNLGDLKWNC